MNTRSSLLQASAATFLLALGDRALAQETPPPPPPPPPVAPAAEPPPPAAAPAPAPVPAAEPTPAEPAAEVSADVQASATIDAAGLPQTGDANERGLELGNTLDGTTGLLRTVAADSGAAGTFRVSLIGSYFTGTGYLCGPCELPDGTLVEGGDDVSQVGTRFALSVTPVDFLEAYASLRNQSTSNNRSEPEAIQLVGDMTFGAKAFLPRAPDRLFSFGGGLEGRLLSSVGGVGFSGGSFGIRGLATADFTRASAKESRVPLRVHLNVGYLFNGSGSVADDIEEDRAEILGSPQRITRTERFGHDIDRVDSFQPALGVEGVFSFVRPFVEWSLDIPMNRQDHTCGNSVTRSAGDSCLSREGFSAVPSRLTIGARAYPWTAPWVEGLAILAAADIGTGATSTFIEEVAPELPYSIHLGLAWAVDTASRGTPTVVEKVVERRLPPPPERYIDGVVLRAGKGEPVAGAVVRFVGRPLTGLVTDEQGKFRTASLAPGEYALSVSAEGYKEGECRATIPPDAPPPAAPPRPGAPATAPSPAPAGPVVVQVSCEVEALPRTATITGTVRDADTTMFVEGATVTITDPMGRSLSLRTDAEGNFRFGNVPAGKSKLSVEADGYLRGSSEVTLEPRRDVVTDVALHPRPKVPNVVVTKNEIKLRKEVHFLHGSAELLPDSMAILEEVADVLRSRPEITSVEIQGHTDDSGTPEINQRLSTDRANAVRDVLVANGVDAGRLTARGYGQEKPLAPNTTPKNRAKNRRVQLVITTP